MDTISLLLRRVISCGLVTEWVRACVRFRCDMSMCVYSAEGLSKNDKWESLEIAMEVAEKKFYSFVDRKIENFWNI